MGVLLYGLLRWQLGSVLAAAFSEGLDEVLTERLDVGVLLLQLVDRDCVRDGLDQASGGAGRDDVEGRQPQLEPVGFEDRLELRNQLRGELLLGQIVRTLHNDRDEPIVRRLPIRTLLLRLPTNLSKALSAKQSRRFILSLLLGDFFWHLMVSKDAATQ